MAKSLHDFVREALATIREIPPEEGARLLAQPDREGWTFLDVREPDEFAAGRIPGARNYPRGFLEVKADLEHPKRDAWLADRERPLILYCGGGHRSALAAQDAARDGLPQGRLARRGLDAAGRNGAIRSSAERRTADEAEHLAHHQLRLLHRHQVPGVGDPQLARASSAPPDSRSASTGSRRRAPTGRARGRAPWRPARARRGSRCHRRSPPRSRAGRRAPPVRRADRAGPPPGRGRTRAGPSPRRAPCRRHFSRAASRLGQTARRLRAPFGEGVPARTALEVELGSRPRRRDHVDQHQPLEERGPVGRGRDQRRAAERVAQPERDARGAVLLAERIRDDDRVAAEPAPVIGLRARAGLDERPCPRASIAITWKCRVRATATGSQSAAQKPFAWWSSASGPRPPKSSVAISTPFSGSAIRPRLAFSSMGGGSLAALRGARHPPRGILTRCATPRPSTTTPCASGSARISRASSASPTRARPCARPRWRWRSSRATTAGPASCSRAGRAACARTAGSGRSREDASTTGESPEDAALRELAEEVGLDAEPSSVLGRLDDYPTRSGFVITPVVVWGGAGRLEPNPQEVAAVYRVPLAELDRPDVPQAARDSRERPPGDLDPAARHLHPRSRPPPCCISCARWRSGADPPACRSTSSRCSRGARRLRARARGRGRRQRRAARGLREGAAAPAPAAAAGPARDARPAARPAGRGARALPRGRGAGGPHPIP